MKNWFNIKNKLRKEEASLSLNISISEDSIRNVLKVAEFLKVVHDSSQWEAIQKSWKSLESTVENKVNEPIFGDYSNFVSVPEYNPQGKHYYLNLLRESANEASFYYHNNHKTIFKYLIELEEEYARTQEYEIFEKICSTRLQIVEFLRDVYDNEYKILQKRLRSTRLQLILVSYIENLRATYRKKVNYIYKKLDDEHELVISFYN